MVRLLTRAEAAIELRLSQRSLRRLNIPVVRIGRKPLYDPRDLAAYVNRRQRLEAIRAEMSPLAQKMLDAIGDRDDVPSNSRVYFISAGHYVKIGVSRRVEGRFEAIQTSTPFKIDHIGDIRGDVLTERAIHRIARRHHYRGEWFCFTLDLSTAITELCDAERSL